VLALNGLLAFLLYSINILLLPFSFLAFTISLLCMAPFIDTPGLAKAGKLIYLSPMLLMEAANKGKIKLHGGTLLEYYFYFQKSWTQQSRKKFVIASFIKGLLSLIENYCPEESDTTIEFTSYILNRRSMERFGFELSETNSLQWIILVINFVPLTIANSMLNKRLKFPKLSQISTYKTTPQVLAQYKHKLVLLEKRM